MTQNELGDMAIAFIKHPEKVLKQLLKDMQQLSTTASGIDKVMGNWESVEGNPENAVKMLKTAMKVNSKLTDVCMRQCMINLTYAASRSFTTDSADMLIKLGRGTEALQTMMSRKMEGKE